MEDKKRGMATLEEIAPHHRETGHREKSFTVMIMRSVGGVRSFKVSPVFILWSLLFFSVFTVVSIFAINGYLDLRRHMTTLNQQVRQLNKLHTNDLRSLQKAEQRIAILQDYVNDLERSQEKSETETVAPPVKKEIPVSPVKAADENNEPEEAPVPESEQKVVGISDFAVRKQGQSLNIDFKLMKVDSGKSAVGGYVHIIASIGDSDSPRRIAYPEVDLKDGLPVNYRLGLPFLIQRFRPMKAQFESEALPQAASSIRVLVYNRSGGLILDKEFKVNNDA